MGAYINLYVSFYYVPSGCYHKPVQVRFMAMYYALHWYVGRWEQVTPLILAKFEVKGNYTYTITLS